MGSPCVEDSVQRIKAEGPSGTIRCLSGVADGRNFVQLLPDLDRQLSGRLISYLGVSALVIPVLSRGHRDMFQDDTLFIKRLGISSLRLAERHFNQQLKECIRQGRSAPSFLELKRIAMAWSSIDPEKALTLASRLDKKLHRPLVLTRIAMDCLRIDPSEPYLLVKEVLGEYLDKPMHKLTAVWLLAPLDLQKANAIHQSLIDEARCRIGVDVDMVIVDPLENIAPYDADLALRRTEEISNPALKIKMLSKIAIALIATKPAQAIESFNRAAALFDTAARYFEPGSFSSTATLLLESAKGLSRSGVESARSCYTSVFSEIRRRLNEEESGLEIQAKFIKVLSFFDAEDAHWAVSSINDPQEADAAKLLLMEELILRDWSLFQEQFGNIANRMKKLEALLYFASRLELKEHEKGVCIIEMALEILRSLDEIPEPEKAQLELSLYQQLARWTFTGDESVLLKVEEFLLHQDTPTSSKVEILLILARACRKKNLQRAHEFILQAALLARLNSGRRVSSLIRVVEFIFKENF